MPEAVLHDGTTIDVEVHGDGPVVMLPVDPRPVEGPQADELRRWGVDPALGRRLIDGLADAFRLVAFPYEKHRLATPAPQTLTPDGLATDLLAVADAAGADEFAYYGYSWLAVAGLQLALRTDRLSALVMGGFPPLDGPYADMLTVTAATHAMALAGTSQDDVDTNQWDGSEEFDWDSAEVTMGEEQARQFLTLYQALDGFDDRDAQRRLTCPRMCFAGARDEIHYGERWNNARVSIAGPLRRHHGELEALGWSVHILDGLDHLQAMQADVVLPLLEPWLISTLR